MEMVSITAQDVIDYETRIGESLCDSPHWVENPFTVLGFAYGMTATDPMFEGLAAVMQVEADKYGNFAEMVCGDIFERWLTDSSDPELNESADDYLEFYATFTAALINTIPAYNARWVANIKELEAK